MAFLITPEGRNCCLRGETKRQGDEEAEWGSDGATKGEGRSDEGGGGKAAPITYDGWD